MPVGMIERRYAEQLEVRPEDLMMIDEVNTAEDVRWLFSFLSSDRRKTYCLYDAPDPDAVRRAAARAGLPADVIVEIQARITPDGELHPV